MFSIIRKKTWIILFTVGSSKSNLLWLTICPIVKVLLNYQALSAINNFSVRKISCHFCVQKKQTILSRQMKNVFFYSLYIRSKRKWKNNYYVLITLVIFYCLLYANWINSLLFFSVFLRHQRTKERKKRNKPETITGYKWKKKNKRLYTNTRENRDKIMR